MKHSALACSIATALGVQMHSMPVVSASTNCPAPVAGTITVSGMNVVAVEANGCTLSNGESIVVAADGSIDFDQGPFFGEGDGTFGIYVPEAVTAADIFNSGVVDVGNSNIRGGIFVKGHLNGSLDNTGTVTGTGTSSTSGIRISHGIGGSLTNSGAVAGTGWGADLSGSFDTIVNQVSGSFNGQSTGMRLLRDYSVTTPSNITDLTNHGSMEGTSGRGLMVNNQVTVSTLTNSVTGEISGNRFSGLEIEGGTVTTLNNAGSITGSDATGQLSSGLKIQSHPFDGGGSVPTLNNSGYISGDGPGGHGIHVSGGSVGLATNTATISGDANGVRLEDYSFYYGYFSIDAEMTTLTNLGTISGGTGSDVHNLDGTLGTLNNAQGGGDALIFSGILPSQYNIVIHSTSSYGILAADSVSGSTSFGLDTVNSTGIANNTLYPGVLVNLTETNLGDASIDGLVAGSTGVYDWILIEASNPGTWDLCIGNCDDDPPPPLNNCEYELELSSRRWDGGDVTLTTNDDDRLVFQITTQGGWCMTEWHVDIEDESDTFPTNRKGNPQVGLFEHSFIADSVLDCSTDSGALINGQFPSDNSLDVAVHAVVYQPLDCAVPVLGDCDDEAGMDTCYADLEGVLHQTALDACEFNFVATSESAWIGVGNEKIGRAHV